MSLVNMFGNKITAAGSGPANTTFWRLFPTIQNYNTDSGLFHSAITEVELYLSTDATGSDLTTGATATATTEASPTFAPPKAIDDDNGTWWSALAGQGSAEQYITVELTAASEVHSVYIIYKAVGYIPQEVDLQYSLNSGSTWITQSTFSVANSAAGLTFTDL